MTTTVTTYAPSRAPSAIRRGIGEAFPRLVCFVLGGAIVIGAQVALTAPANARPVDDSARYKADLILRTAPQVLDALRGNSNQAAPQQQPAARPRAGVPLFDPFHR